MTIPIVPQGFSLLTTPNPRLWLLVHTASGRRHMVSSLQDQQPEQIQLDYVASKVERWSPPRIGGT